MITPRLTGYEGPRTPQLDEWEAVLEMSRSIFFKDSASYMEAARRWPMAFHEDYRENSFAMFRDGEPVATIGRLERDFVVRGCLLRMGFVGGVCTHPDRREKGLASTTLAATMDQFHKHGVDFVFISGARPLYYGAGADHVGGLTQFTLTPDDLAQLNDSTVTVRAATTADAALMAKLNQREGLHFVRPLADYVVTIEHGHCSGRPCEIRIVMLSDTPLGYVIFANAESKDGEQTYALLEYAGDLRTVLAGLAQASGDASLRVTVPPESGMADTLASMGFPSMPTARRGTMKVIDFARTMQKLSPHFTERSSALVETLKWTQGHDRYVGWSGKGCVTIDGEANMLRMLLGTPPDREIARVAADGDMRSLLTECLPIPLPSIEMNKI